MTNHSKLVALLATASTLAIAPATFAQDAGTYDEIVVTGIRQSLRAAVDLKRSDSRIVDAIVAEDIGKLPDNNIAEALQRITGVSINKDFGIGESVSIRGLPQNRVELNGRSTVGDDRDGISLEDFPSSFLKSIEVVKTPTADMIEGALGGTVRMNTIRPLELNDRLLSGSLDFEYAEKTENVAPIANIAIGDSWTLGNGSQFGIVANVAYQDREIRQDEFFNRVRLYDEDVNGLEANTPSGRFAVREQNTVEQYVDTRERTAAFASLQFAPASIDANLYLDLAYTDREGRQNGSSILDVGGARTYNSGTTQDGNGQVNGYELTDAFVIPKTWSDFRNTETVSYALGGDWDATDRLTVSGEYAYTESDSYRPNLEFNLRPVNRTAHEQFVADGNTVYDASLLRHTVDASFFQIGDDLPSVTYSDPQALLASENLAFREFRVDEDTTTNEEDAFRFDVEYENPFNVDFLKSIEAGVRFTTNDYEFNRERFRAPDLYRYAFDPFDGDETFDEDGRVVSGATPRVFWLDDIEAAFPGSIVTVDHHNSFEQTGLSGPNDLLTYRIFNGNQLTPEFGFEVLDQLYAGAVDREGNLIVQEGGLQANLATEEGAFREISEDTSAYYISADLEYDRFSAVVGVRYIETDLDSNVIVGGLTQEGGNSYEDTLPSLNLSYDYSDETKIRFAAAKVMRRPDYEDLSPSFVPNGAYTSADRGAIDLDPFRATQYDLSVEHYFNEGGLFSAAVFYKDVESFLSSETFCEANTGTQSVPQQVTEWENICLLTTAGVNRADIVQSTLTDFDDFASNGFATADAAGFAFTEAQRDAGLTGISTSRTTNGQNGTIKGFELAFQQEFTFLPGIWSNFGVNANYTYADSEQPDGNPLEDISENTLNTQLYWENEKFQARLAYNYRDEYLEDQEVTRVANVGARALNNSTNDITNPDFDPTAGNSYQDDRGQLDASAAWNINENFVLVGNVTNLLAEPTQFVTELGSPWKYTEADRRWSIGVRAKF